MWDNENVTTDDLPSWEFLSVYYLERRCSMNNNQRQAIIDYLERGDKFTDLLIRELEREDITDLEKRTYSSLLDAILGATELYCSMSEWPDNVEVFLTKMKRENEKDNKVELTIKRGPKTMQRINDVSGVVGELPIDSLQYDKLITLIRDMLSIAEHEHYITGFTECMNVVRNGGFKGLEDKLETMISHKKE